jgi:tRNA A-37 threonylcarbamoyl transferase component Bud32
MALCRQCGVEIAGEENYCPFCGARQEDSPAPEAASAGADALELDDDNSRIEDLDALPHKFSSEDDGLADEEGLSDGPGNIQDETGPKDVGESVDSPEPNEMADLADKSGSDIGSESASEASSWHEAGKTSSVSGGDTDGRKPGLKPLSEGAVLYGRYEIVRKIGGGGMGAVYLATDRNLGGVERAVKEMVQSSIEEEQQRKAVDDFRRESTILSSLDHPAIPTIYDYFYDERECRFYLVMKYISGGDLAGRLRASAGGRIDELTVTEWAVQIADVLSYLHGLPTTIVYRDLKPSNIMLDGKTGRVMLIDFGIARSINQAAQEKGVTAVGTMGYAPPELFSGQVEPRSDIYSLGSTMFHLLTGADPQNNPLLIFDFQKNPRPRQINPQLSDQMERILMRSVEYNADSRFASAEEMKQVLSDHLTNLRAGRLFAASAAKGSSRPICFVPFAVPSSRSLSRACIPRYIRGEVVRPS